MSVAPTSRASAGHVAVGQTVAFAGRDFQEDAPFLGQGRLFPGDQAGVGQDVDVSLQGGPVGAGGHRLRQGLAVNDDEGHAQGPGLGDQGPDQGRGQVGEFQAGNDMRLATPVQARPRRP